jgi:hypothetical protein
MKIFKLIFILILSANVSAQSFNEDKTAFSNFVERMYRYKPFEGVKIVEDYSQAYLVSALSLPANKYPNESMMMRVASVKAQSQASTFLNGSEITMDMILTTEEKTNADGVKESTTAMIESIKENSVGFVRAMELLTSFEIDNGDRVLFVYIKEM